MYTSFEISNFRCFEKLKVSPLERVNLFTGLNGVGKTALLEALFIPGTYDPSVVFTLGSIRGVEPLKAEPGAASERPWTSLFRGFDESQPITLAGECTDGRRIEVRLSSALSKDELRQLHYMVRTRKQDQHSAPSSLTPPLVLGLQYSRGDEVRRHYLLVGEGGSQVYPLPPAPPCPIRFLPALYRYDPKAEAELYGQLLLQGKQEAVLEALRILQPKLGSLTVIPQGDRTMLYADVGEARLVPLPLVSDGLLRIARLFLFIVYQSGGILLVDEVENGIHHSVMPKVWEAIGKAAERFNTQVIATTHSRECIVAAHQAFSAMKGYAFRLHRLEEVHGEILDVTYNQETLSAAIEAGLEVR